MCKANCTYGCGLPCHRQAEGDHGNYHTCGRGPNPAKNGCPGLIERNAKREREEKERELKYRQEFLEANKPKREKLNAMLDKFLSEPRLDGNGWAPVTDGDVEDLNEIFNLIEEMKCDRDADGDSTLELEVVNRVTHERMSFRPVPYAEWKMRDTKGASDWEVLKVAEFNLALAQDRFEKAFRLYRMHLEDKKNE